ncbi:hypothetical protein YC2023_023195 [Brassica napus]
MARYTSFPTNFRYRAGFLYTGPSSDKSLWFCSMGVEAGLQPSNPASATTSKAYFLCVKNIPCGPLAISIPRKYLAFPKSFILKHLLRYALNLAITFKLFPAMIKSSTYTSTRTELLPSMNVKSE